jgi:hypothetical protein
VKVGDTRYIAEEKCKVLRYNGKGKQILKDASVMREKAEPVGKERRISDADCRGF